MAIRLGDSERFRLKLIDSRAAGAQRMPNTTAVAMTLVSFAIPDPPISRFDNLNALCWLTGYGTNGVAR
jgi:hypothetical protein